MVVLSEIEESLTHSVGEVKAILTGTYEKTCQKDFLRQTSTSTTIQRGKNYHRKRCSVFYLKFMPQSMVDRLQRSEWVATFFHTRSYMCHSVNKIIFFAVTSDPRIEPTILTEVSGKQLVIFAVLV